MSIQTEVAPQTSPAAQAKPRGIFVAGVDLGQMQDYSALVIVEARGTPQVMSHRGYEVHVETMPLVQCDVRHVERFPLGMKYAIVQQQMAERIARMPKPRYLVLDQTGVGMGVVEIFAPLSPIGITFTSSGQPHAVAENWYHVAKRDLIGSAQVLLQNHILRIGAHVQFAELLINELLNFRMKISVGGHDSYEAWREKEHDDLVNALAIATWTSELIISRNALIAAQGLARRWEDPPMISPY